MTTIPPANVRALVAELTDIQTRLKRVEAGGRATQLGKSTVEGESIQIKNKNGDLMGVIGMVTPQDSDEAVFHIQPLSKTPPVAPPAASLTPFAGGVNVSHNGTGQPVDYSYHNVYWSYSNNFSGATLEGRIYGNDVLPITPVDNTIYVWLTQVNTSGKESVPSAVASAAPTAVVATEILDGIVDELALADGAVTEAKVATAAITEVKIDNNAISAIKIKTGAITEQKIDNDAITAAKIKAGAVTATKISDNAIETRHVTAGSITAGTIAAGAVTADKVAANSITGDKIAANTIEAGNIAAGQIFAQHIGAGSILAEHVTADSITAASIQANAVTADKIIANAIQAQHIAANTIQASHITSGAITARTIAALAITADKISANSINAGHLQAGSVTAAKLEANLVLASRIIAGTLNGDRTELHPTQGLQGFTNGGTTRTLWFNTATGNLLATGTWRTGLYENAQERIEIDTDGTQTFVASGNFVAGKIENIGLQGLQFRSGKLGTNAGYLFLNSGYVGINWGTQGGIVPASFGCNGAGIQSWGRLVGLRYEQRYAGDGTQPRIFMLGTDNSGSDVGSSVIHITKRTLDNSAAMCAPVQNSGLVFYPNEMQVTDGTGNGYGPIRASSHLTPSSEALKDGITDIAIKDGRTEWDLIEGAPAMTWRYTDVAAPDKPRLADGDVVQLRKRRPDGTEYYEDAKFTAPPVRRRRRHFGPMAEDLHAIDPNAVVGSNAKTFATDNRDMTGILWAAMDMMIKRQRILENLLAANGIQMPAWPGKGDLIEGIGKHVPGRTRRHVDHATGAARKIK